MPITWATRSISAQGGGNAVGGEMCGDVRQRALGVLHGRDAGGVDAVRIGAEEGEALRGESGVQAGFEL